MQNGLINAFIQIMDRELARLESEISQYPNESLLWKTAGEIKNPAGNLCMHLCGNLQHYIGAQLGKTSYERNRPHEFSARDVSREKLLAEIRATKEAVISTLKKLIDSDLQKMYPEEVLGYPMTTGFFLIHLMQHFGYHLGQINYHRRLLASIE